MAKARWSKFEEQVRGVAELVWRSPCKARTIAGINFDGVIELSAEEYVIVEASVREDLRKVRQDIANINAARLTLAGQGIVCRGWIVLDADPTKSMEATALTSKINIASINSFAANFFQFARYLNARLEAAFGSAIDPITGAIDTAEYVPVSYINRVDGREIDIARVCDLLLEGKNIVLLGEYGSGKSRCIRQIFSLLAVDWGITFKFPFAINLRECWGLKSGKEILRRSLLELGLDELEASAVRVFNTKNCILLIDGFDEVGSQSWSVDEDRLRQLRAQAVSGVKDAIRSVGGGCLIAGREHYFSSEAEMFSALGLDKKNTIVLQAKDEFTEEEMESYFELTGVNVDLPSWLPRRPLICQTIATLTDDELERMFGIDNQDAEFWNHFINVLCERDARINANFDAGTIYQVFLKLSRRTRNLPANVGPISQRTLQEAFEEVVGKLPVEEAAVMLLRLPSLGRIGLESSDRQFVDTFILDGLRARDIIGAIEADNETRREIAADSWMNPLEPLGQSVLALEIDRRFESFRQLAEQASRSENKTLCGDIIAAAARSELESTFDFNGLAVSGASFSDLDLHRLNVQNFEIENAVVQVLVLPSSPPSNVRIKNSLVEKVSGASSFSGLPSWVSLSSVDRFDSVQTVAEIRRAGLSPAHEVLVSILKKTFMQKGAGRKEAALYRGFGAGSVKTIAQEVLPFLMKEGVLSRHRGNEGWIYSPERSQAARVGKILDQLRSSDDPLWKATDAFN